jgi:hypothetical protein
MRRSSYLVCVGLGKCAVRVRSALLSFVLSGFAFGAYHLGSSRRDVKMADDYVTLVLVAFVLRARW